MSAVLEFYINALRSCPITETNVYIAHRDVSRITGIVRGIFLPIVKYNRPLYHCAHIEYPQCRTTHIKHSPVFLLYRNFPTFPTEDAINYGVKEIFVIILLSFR